MSCDYNGADSIDLGSLAIGVSVKQNGDLNHWNPCAQFQDGSQNLSEFRQGKSQYSPANKYDKNQFVSGNPGQPKPQYYSPVHTEPGTAESLAPKPPPQMPPGMFGAGPPSGGGFSTMAALGMLTNKTIERFFPQQKPPIPSPGFPPCNFAVNQATATTAAGINSAYSRYPSTSPPSQQVLSSSYASSGGAYSSYSPPGHLPTGPSAWPTAFPTGQESLRHGAPSVKMEWNEFGYGSGDNISARMPGPALYREGKHTCNNDTL